MCCKRGDLQGKPPSRFHLMDHMFSIARGLQTGFKEIYELYEYLSLPKYRNGIGHALNCGPRRF
jgi:hypothetical protein